MKFICRQTCIDSSKCFSYRTGHVYDFSAADVDHLKKIDHFRRFDAVDMEAKLFTGEIAEPEGQKEQHLDDLTKAQLIDYAKEKEIKIDPAAKKEDIIKSIVEA
jgi:hypothetical protein